MFVAKQHRQSCLSEPRRGGIPPLRGSQDDEVNSSATLQTFRSSGAQNRCLFNDIRERNSPTDSSVIVTLSKQ